MSFNRIIPVNSRSPAYRVSRHDRCGNTPLSRCIPTNFTRNAGCSSSITPEHHPTASDVSRSRLHPFDYKKNRGWLQPVSRGVSTDRAGCRGCPNPDTLHSKSGVCAAPITPAPHSPIRPMMSAFSMRVLCPRWSRSESAWWEILSSAASSSAVTCCGISKYPCSTALISVSC